ncbi:hypothetical protein KsCSTR_33560 [Candidatus Kuenenia stuttgartiensis]|uniref:Uncharacterized protein n=1 Tax=Kuenenia stuttgartiensis TaxID=174633 RepID=Q1Q4D2_KUEST|nr:hypothetical protein KsCSTR_33560 [Candidatus Kuenenia stuttgartiensis]CAJ74881.1 unknown protein [Candidatus Kuenenia stuttgartiensis]
MHLTVLHTNFYLKMKEAILTGFRISKGAFLIFCNSLDFWKNKNARSQAGAWERAVFFIGLKYYNSL